MNVFDSEASSLILTRRAFFMFCGARSQLVGGNGHRSYAAWERPGKRGSHTCDKERLG